MSFQTYSDTFLERTLLPFVPRRVTPNQISALRILALPFIYYFLISENYAAGSGFFIAAAITDTLDGALARRRHMITETGKVLDAVADRGLIALVAIYFIPHLFGWSLLLMMIVLEIANGTMAYVSRRRIGHNPGANWAGKLKMFVQCVAFSLIFLGVGMSISSALSYAYLLLIGSVVLTLLECFLYPQDLI